MRFVISQLAVVAVLAMGTRAHAVTYFVSPCGQDFWTGVQPGCVGPFGPKRTIQAAINVAANGDTVTVLPGTYIGTIDLQGKAITVIGSAGADDTTLDSNGAAPIVRCDSGEGPATVIRGLRLTGADTTLDGGAMLNVASSPTIIECTFISNYTTGNGAAMLNFGASPTIINCLFQGNWAGEEPPGANQGQGGAIFCAGGNLTISETRFHICYATNRGGCIAMFNNATATVTDCDFYTSGSSLEYGIGGGIYVDHGTLTVHDSLFDGVNAFSQNGEGGSIMAVNGSQVTVAGTSFESAVGQVRGGAASLINSNSSFVDCDFTDLVSLNGGALYVSGGMLQASLCIFSSNEAIEHGGAAHFVNAQVELDNCMLVGNDAYNGAGVYALSCQLTAEDCHYTNNAAQNVGGGINFGGAGGYTALNQCAFTGNSGTSGGGMRGSESGGLVINCTFEANTATLLGGGLATGTAVMDIRDTLFTGNHSDGGGGGLSGGRQVLRCEFINNSANSTGGGALEPSPFSQPSFINCLFTGNTTNTAGAAVGVHSGGGARMLNCVVHHNTAPANMGAIYEALSGGSIRITNSVVANNTGGGIFVEDPETESLVANTIVWGNPSGGQFVGNVPQVRFCNVQGGVKGIGNINAIPLFAGAIAGNYHLSPGSPCIDAGNNWSLPTDVADLDGDMLTLELASRDFDGNPRIADAAGAANNGCGAPAIVDIGPFETVGIVVTNLRPGDANGDGIVNADDLVAVILGWGPCVGCCTADFDANGFVDVDDLITVVLGWG